MKRVYLYTLISLISLTLTSCIRNEFEISADLAASVNSTYRLIYYASDKRGGVTIESGMAIASGKAQMKGITRLPVCVFIYEGSSQRPSALFYARRGDKIRITGPDASPFTWKIEGNEINDRLSEWRLANSSLLRGAGAETVNRAVADYVKANPSDPVSAILLGAYYDRSAKNSDFFKLLDMLEGDVAEEEWVSITGRPDMTMQPLPPLKDVRLPANPVLQTAATGCDTVHLRAGKPTIFLCRVFGATGDRQAADTLKRLSRAFADSAKRNIVELYCAADSASWRTSLRSDTLRGVVRVRMPREFAEPLLISAGVRQAPWIIVTDGKGRAVYSGSDPAEGAKSFRKLMKR